MNEITLRQATVADAALLAEMEQACFSDPWSREYFENLLKNPAVCFIIAETDGTAVAYGGMTAVMDECDIINVAVIKDMRRKGIGKLIVEHLLGICRTSGVTTVFLEHRASNISAAALYAGFGFNEYATRRKYYSSPTEDAVLRKLIL